MKTKVLVLVVCAALASSTGYALTADPNIINPGFEWPVCQFRDDQVADWVEAENNSTETRNYGSGGWNNGAGSGENCAQLVGIGDCIYQAVATFSLNTPYNIQLWIGKRNQLGPVGRIELWAGGSPVLTDPADDDLVNNYYGSSGFPLAVAGATRVDYAEFDYSHLGVWAWMTGTKQFILTTGDTHSTSDPLYLLIVRDGTPGGQLGVDDISMVILPDTAQIEPANGAIDLPITTDANSVDDTNTTLAWMGPGTYEGETFDVYFGTTEPNTLLPNYGMTPLETGTTATSTDPSPSGDLAYGTPYYWVVDTYEPNLPDPPIKHSGVETYSTFTTLVEDVPPVVTFTQNGFITWTGAPVVAFDATVFDLETITVLDYEFTAQPADYTGDPNAFLTYDFSDLTAPTFTMQTNVTDPNAFGFYEITLTATDSDDDLPAQTGSDTVWFSLHETPCGAFEENGGWLNNFDDNEDCIINLVDAAAWFEAWLEDRNPSDPTYY